MSFILTNAKEKATFDGIKFICSGADSGAYTTVRNAIKNAYVKSTGITPGVSDAQSAWFRVHYIDQSYLTHYAIFEGVYDDSSSGVTPVSGSIVLSSSGTSLPNFDQETNPNLYILGVSPGEGLAGEDFRIVGDAGQPVYENSWEAFNGSRQLVFKRSLSGWVSGSGLAKNGSSDSAVIYTLPEGYRPSGNRTFASWSNNGACRLDISINGQIRAITNGSTLFTSVEFGFYIG